MPSPREVAIEKLIPRLVKAGMFAEVARAARATPHPTKRANGLTALFEANAYDTALENFFALSGEYSVASLKAAIDRAPASVLGSMVDVIAGLDKTATQAELLGLRPRRDGLRPSTSNAPG